MKLLAVLLPLQLTLATAAAATDGPALRPTVVLLHGLARGHGSMEKMASALDQAGFRTCNLSYPSTSYPVQELAELLLPAILACRAGGTGEINFVTHSMGGIIVRLLAASHPELAIARVVMLSPPNRGSEVVDKLGSFGVFKWFNGPAGQELGTGPESLPSRLGPAPFATGIITGDRSINPLLSMLIPGEDDGKVAVSRAKLEGMRDFLVIHATHPLIMRNRRAIAQTIHFLRRGSFAAEER